MESFDSIINKQKIKRQDIKLFTKINVIVLDFQAKLQFYHPNNIINIADAECSNQNSS